MLKNRFTPSSVLALSTVVGVVALVGSFCLLDQSAPYAAWGWALLPGLAVGVATAAAQLALGTHSVSAAVNAALLAIVSVAWVLAVLTALAEASHDLGLGNAALPLAALLVFFWLLLISAFVLVIPATAGSLVTLGAAYAVRTGVRHCRDNHTIEQ